MIYKGHGLLTSFLTISLPPTPQELQNLPQKLTELEVKKTDLPEFLTPIRVSTLPNFTFSPFWNSKMTALHYNDQVTLPGGNDYDLSVTQLHQRQNDSTAALPHNTSVYAGTVSQTLQKLHKGLSLLPISNGRNEAGVPSGNNHQQLYIPVLVASLPNQDIDPNSAVGIFANGLDTPATTPTVDIAINAEEKADNEKLTITPAKEPKSALENKNSSVHVESIEVTPSPPSTPTKQVSPKLYQEEFLSSATRLKKRIEETDELIVCPGVYDGFSARIALHVGFTALYMVISLFTYPSNFNQWLTTPTDRCRHYSLSPRNGRFGSRPAPRHERACRNDCESRSSGPALDCRYGHRLRG